MVTLTSVICVSLDVYNIEKLLDFRLTQYNLFHKDYVKYLFILSGKRNKKIDELLKLYDVDCIYVEDKRFNYSELKNIAIKNVKTAYIIFEDIDVFHTKYFYKDVAIETKSLEDGPFNFLTIPVAYLSKNYSELVLKNSKNIDEIKSDIDYLLNFDSCDNSNFLQHFIHMSSLIITHTKTAQFVGGFDEGFKSWGGEDRDFVFRLLAVNTKINLPQDFTYTSTENTYVQHKYVGWKSLWGLHGDYMFNKGYLSFHLFHETRKWRTLNKTQNNINFAAEKAKLIGKDYFNFIIPLGNNKDDTPVNYIYGRNPHLFNLDIYKYLSGFNILEEGWDIEYCKKILLQSKNVGIIIFWNPYGTQKRLEIYRELKKAGYNIIVAERGALPNSIVFDKEDLCVYSSSYNRKNWDREIPDKYLIKTKEYINELIKGETTLEKNSNRLPESIINAKLHLNRYNKKILICFQLDDDTVTNTDYPISYKEFVEQMQNLSQHIPDGCILMYKNHPLSNYKHQLDGATCVDSYHIHDLLTYSDYIIVYNSGVGVLAQAFKKLVFIFGPAFYQDDYFNIKVKNFQEIIDSINFLPKTINMEKVVLFYSFLIHKMYSFCFMSDAIIRKKEFSTPVYFKRISYYSIQIYPYERWEGSVTKIFDPRYSILFKRFYSFWDNFKITKLPKVTSKPAQKNLNVSKNNTKSTFIKKLNKFRSNPYKFFEDSHTIFKNLKYFCSKNNI